MFSRSTAAHVERLETRSLLTLTPLGPEVTVPFPTEMSRFDMAVAGDGSFIVVADPIEQTGSPDLVAVRYDANGEQIGSPLTLDDRGFNVSVSMDADGDAVVAYQKGTNGVYVVRVSKDGVASAPQRVGTAPAGLAIWETSISMDDSGGYFVAWLQREFDFSPMTTPFRAFDATGQPRGPQFDPPGGNWTLSYFDVNIATVPDGSGAILTHVSGRHDNGEDTAFYRVSTSGVLGSGPVENSGVTPEVAVFPDGSFVVGSTTINHRLPPSQFGGFVQRFDASGAPVSERVPVGASLPGSPFDNIQLVSVDALPDGGFVAGFSQEWGGVVTTYVRRFDASGVAIEGPTAFDVGPARAHRIGTDATGTAVLAYLQTSDPTLSSGAVHVRRLTTSPSVLQGTELFVDGTEGNDHIILERVRNNLFVNVNGSVERFNASAVQFLSISGLGGDDDIVNASAIPSTISGGDGADTIWGGTGADSLRGFGGDDVLHGGDGGDHLAGGGDNDRLFGDGGDDRVDGQLGGNTLVGGDGVDTLVSGNSFLDLEPDTGRLKFNGSDGGDDRVSFTRESLGRLAITIDGATHRMYAGSVAFLELNGWAGDDAFTVQGTGAPRASMRGGDGNDTLVGGPGNDTLNGQGGHDFVEGRDGDDRLDADGNATLHGGNGNDVLHASFGPSILRGGYGDDFLQGGAFADALYGDDGGDDSLAAGGGEHGHDTIEAGNGNDSLYGEGGHDLLDGEQDNDYLEGGAGNDTLEGGWNDDTMFGLAGNDRLLASEVFTVHPDVVRGGPGDDVAAIDEGADDVLAVETVI